MGWLVALCLVEAVAIVVLAMALVRVTRRRVEALEAELRKPVFTDRPVDHGTRALSRGQLRMRGR